MRTKYHNRKVTVEGETYDSMKEYRRFCELVLLQRAGEISGLQRQVKFQLIPAQRTRGPDGKTRTERAVVYIADFVYTDNRTGRQIVEDVKGMRTKEYILKRKMLLFFRGIAITEI